MKGEILVNHKEVYNRCASLLSYIDSEIICEAQKGYADIDQQLQLVDSATNAQLIEAMRYNQEKTMICAQTLCRLLGLIESATRELEAEDRQMAHGVASGRNSGEEVEA